MSFKNTSLLLFACFAILTNISASATQSTNTLTTDLYRSGNSTIPRMAHIRPTDIVTFQKNGQTWVKGGEGGISTFSDIKRLNGDRYIWKAPKGTRYPQGLVVVNDNPVTKHWSWRPAYDMPMTQYTTLMEQTNSLFQKVVVTPPKKPIKKPRK